MRTNFNIPLRSRIIERALILEKESSETLKVLLRLRNLDTKTLCNKSTSFSFKNKIDLLYDLRSISKDEHNYFLKFMELRNQFAHNYDCSTYLDFEEINPKTYKYIEKSFPNAEKSFSQSIKLLFNKCEKCLTKLKEEYKTGVSFEVEKLVTNELFRNIENIIETSFHSWEEWKDEIDEQEFENEQEKYRVTIEGLKRTIVLTIINKRQQLYKVVGRLSFDELTESLKSRVPQDQLEDYIKMLDKKSDYIDDDIFDNIEVLEDIYNEEETGTNTV